MAPTTSYHWETGTAYDFFFSLQVLHQPERFHVRPAWAAGMRSRIPTEYHALLALAFEDPIFFPSYNWLTHLPDPTDASDVLADLEKTNPEDRLALAFFGHQVDDQAYYDLLFSVRERGEVGEGSSDTLYQLMGNRISGNQPTKKRCDAILALWAKPGNFGEDFYKALKIYYDAFFKEEEKRIRPYLEMAISQAQTAAAELPFEALFNRLSQGVALATEDIPREATFAASFWSTPYIYLNRIGSDGLLTIFGSRPLGISLVPGEAIPEPLVSGLKALGDPTRLRILHALREETLTPTQIAKTLRLRTPTVLHHLDQLRSLGFVQLTVGRKERYYSLRPEGIIEIEALLWSFLQID